MVYKKKEREGNTLSFLCLYKLFIYMQYKKLVRQISYDNGVTWQTMPNIIKFEKKIKIIK